MRFLKKNSPMLVNEEGREWSLFLFAVALAYNTTPHTAARYTPFFLLHGRKALLPVQRYLAKPCLDLQSRRRLSRLWKAHVYVDERHAVHASERSDWLKKL